MILYSAKSTIDGEGRSAYRVTKFNNGEVESSYLTDGIQCDCPAGVRPTCRHRQMLPIMKNEGIINTHWFLDWARPDTIVDFEGTPRSAYDLAPPPEREALQEVTPSSFTPEMQLALELDAEKLSAITGEEHSVTFLTDTPQPAKPWRRL